MVSPFLRSRDWKIPRKQFNDERIAAWPAVRNSNESVVISTGDLQLLHFAGPFAVCNWLPCFFDPASHFLFPASAHFPPFSHLLLLGVSASLQAPVGPCWSLFFPCSLDRMAAPSCFPETLVCSLGLRSLVLSS